jgi:adenosine deaminase
MAIKNIHKFLELIPKTDLHVHLDGSLRLSTLIELAKAEKIKLPSYEEAGLKELVFKDHYKDLPDYLTGFAYTCDVLRNKENLERVSYELAIDNINENVRYLEVRFAPQLLINKDMPSIEIIIEAVHKGLKRARKEHELDPAVISGEDIPFKYGIIVGAMRCFNEHYSPYYADLIKTLPHTPIKSIFKIASMDLAKAAVHLRNEKELPILGFDLLGAESGYPAIDHHEAYKYVHKNFMGKTVHAGEAYGAESIFQAITDCHANRIGHGTFLFDASEIKDTDINAPEEFSNSLADYIAGRRISIEVCPTSNLQTIPSIKSIKDHPVKKMIDKKFSVTICTDNRLVSSTTVTRELSLLVDNLSITTKQLRDIVIAGFKGCFYYGDYVEQRNFVRKAINRYDKLAKEILI